MHRPDHLARLYIDFDSFFASAEQYLEPRLRGKPVGVIPIQSKHTGLIAVGLQAKARGVRNGMRLDEARAVCPDITFQVARHDAYVELHHKIHQHLSKHVEVIGTRSIDELVARLMKNEAERAFDLCLEIKHSFAKAFAPCLSLSIGVSTNELLAKIGAEMNKPDGLMILDPKDLPDAIAHLELREIPGISHGIHERLHKAGIKNIRQVYAMQPKQARKLWGGVQGERFLAQLQGYQVELPPTQKRMFGHSRILPFDWRCPEKALNCARVLTVKAARRMRREGYLASSFSLYIKLREGRPWEGSMRFAAARDDYTFLKVLQTAFDAWHRYNRSTAVKSVSVTLHGLTKLSERQNDLFQNEDKRTKDWEKLSDIGDDLRRRFGGKSFSIGFMVEPPGGYAGGKIAFNRIPDAQDFV
jgi:DNA polymerase-4